MSAIFELLTGSLTRTVNSHSSSKITLTLGSTLGIPTLSLPSLKELLDHSYIRNGNIFIINDNTKFINHSETPNLELSSDNLEVAKCDIKKGDELTENYLLSYDENDFFNIDFSKFNSQEEIINYLKSILLKKETKSDYAEVSF